MHRGHQTSPSSWDAYIVINEFRLFSDADDETNLSDDFIVATNGNIGIGIAPTQKLHVDGNILATGAVTSDYVFEKYFEGESERNPDYEFKPIEKIEQYVKKNKHLPGVPSAKDIENQGGILVNRATEINLEKIEELYLYLFELNKENKQLQKQLAKLEEEHNSLKKLLQSKP